MYELITDFLLEFRADIWQGIKDGFCQCLFDELESHFSASTRQHVDSVYQTFGKVEQQATFLNIGKDLIETLIFRENILVAKIAKKSVMIAFSALKVSVENLMQKLGDYLIQGAQVIAGSNLFTNPETMGSLIELTLIGLGNLAGEVVGGIAGATGGAIAGGAIGSFIPGIGTGIGALTGGVLGAWGLIPVGRKAGQELVSIFLLDSFADKLIARNCDFIRYSYP